MRVCSWDHLVDRKKVGGGRERESERVVRRDWTDGEVGL